MDVLDDLDSACAKPHRAPRNDTALESFRFEFTRTTSS